MSEQPTEEASHLEVEEYEDTDRAEPPEWYDDNVNVGDVANDAAAEEE